MSRSSQLLELQHIDTQFDHNHDRLVEIELILSNDTEIILAKSQLDLAFEDLKITSNSLREAEFKVQEQRRKIKQTDSKLYGGAIKNPKELQDLQNESNSLKRFLSVLEDRQLTLMLEVDDKKDLVADAQAVYDQALDNAKRIHTDLSAEKIEINNTNERLKAERQRIITSILPEDMVIYERLRKQRLGVAVSEVKDRACSACGATLTAALAQSARFPSQITYCETCGRILCSD
jgi:predicted  nucleic acid-binding Zn-ribbon protein